MDKMTEGTELLNMKTSEEGNDELHPLLTAVQDANPSKVRKILDEKKVQKRSYTDMTDWVVTYDHLINIKDSNGRTALHLAAAIGDPKLSLACVKILLDNFQLIVPGSPSPEEKVNRFINMPDKFNETALHLAIEKQAADVVAFLLIEGANIAARNKNGVEAIKIIYEKLPEAMTQLYDRAVEFKKDGQKINHQMLTIKWGAVIFFSGKPERNEAAGSVEKEVLDKKLDYESRNLRYVLNAHRWGAKILCHPLIELYLYEKWKKIQCFFWLTFVLELFWLLTYSAAFVSLHLERKRDNVTVSSGCEEKGADSCNTVYGSPFFWAIVGVCTLVCLCKEILNVSTMGRDYLNLERITRCIFIALVIILCALLILGLEDVVASLSVVGVIMSTMLVIFLLGKTPYLGHQVAAWKKVLYSFGPHILVFFAWFTGFGLIFWAILYEANVSWIVGMVALMAAMGTGELNAKDYIEDSIKDSEGSIVLGQVVLVLAILFFAILIVTLYFNLLIGYAVSDIQVLKEKAKALQLSNKLNTVYFIESFLVSRVGRLAMNAFNAMRSYVTPSQFHSDPLDSIFIIKKDADGTSNGIQHVNIEDVPPKLRNHLTRLAYENQARIDKEQLERRPKIRGFIYGRPSDSEPFELVHDLSATVSSDGKTIKLQFNSVKLSIVQRSNGEFELRQSTEKTQD